MRGPFRWLVGIAVVLTLAAGSCDERGLGDAPVGDMQEEPRSVIVMPDRFPNLAYVCDGTTAIYVTTRDASPVVVPNSVNCEAPPR